MSEADINVLRPDDTDAATNLSGKTHEPTRLSDHRARASFDLAPARVDVRDRHVFVAQIEPAIIFVPGRSSIF
jgi:hypothetical protein